ncbi:MAG TPA: hypothetical protein VEI03_10555 [Stellaceae bacterium]|nr:hypothetical protein [Stellaceae bacterium]
MGLLYEVEIKRDVAQKTAALTALERGLRGWTGGAPVPVAELMAALEEARAAVRDGAVCLENHFGGLIPLDAETLGDILLLLRAADAVVGRVSEAMTPRR